MNQKSCLEQSMAMMIVLCAECIPGKLSRVSIDCFSEHLFIPALDHDACNVAEDGQQLAVDKIHA